MRLLLLLSALLGALTGVAGGRVSAQPVTASIAAPAVAARVQAVSAVRVGLPASAASSRAPALAGTRLVAVLVAAAPLYADRRRE